MVLFLENLFCKALLNYLEVVIKVPTEACPSLGEFARGSLMGDLGSFTLGSGKSP